MDKEDLSGLGGEVGGWVCGRTDLSRVKASCGLVEEHNGGVCNDLCAYGDSFKLLWRWVGGWMEEEEAVRMSCFG